MAFRFVLQIALVSVCSATLYRRQLPDLSCSAPELLVKLESFPVDEMSGESSCKQAALNFTQIDPEEYIERRGEVFAALEEICSDDCLPYVLDLVDSCLPAFRTSLGQACASNGRFACWQGPIYNNGTGVPINCLATLRGVEACSDYCREAIVDVRDSLECCVNNVFNTTVFGTGLSMLQVANGRLWDACRVERLSFCPLPESFSTESSMLDPTGGAPRLAGSVVIIFQAIICLLGVPFG